MKKFKTIDFFVSVALLTVFLGYWLIKKDNIILTAYFTTGSWQVISMLVHEHNRCFVYKNGSRYMYHRVTFFSLATFPFGSFVVLLFTAPFMAIYYTWLCYHEVYVKMQRPLALLK